jgi:transposase InsO family protein
MDEQQQKQIAVFRFGVISDFVNRPGLERGEQERLLREKSERAWQIPFSRRTRLSRSTIASWIRRYQESGGKLESLQPAGRNDRGRVRALDEETIAALLSLRREMPKAAVPSLIATMKERYLIKPGVTLSPATVYRLLHKEGLIRPEESPAIDRRKFEAELPNDIWQSDAMHGPMVMDAGKRRKSFLFAFIDDMSRLITHGEFFLNEKLDSYLGALRVALLKRGLPRKLYVDNGPAFRSTHLEEITASLGIALIHSKPYKPQGRGKIERFFQTVQRQFLPGFTGTTLIELNEAFDAWLRDLYHARPHSATGLSPLKRFADHMECLRPAPGNLEDYFRKRARRRVANDRTVSLNGNLFEAPVGLIGKQVTLHYHEHDPARTEILFENRSHGFLNRLDLHVNCRVRRIDRSVLAIEPLTPTTLGTGKLTFSSGEDEA